MFPISSFALSQDLIRRYSNAFGFNYTTVASIIWCESRFNENVIGLNKKNGKVWSKDIGLMQINNIFHQKIAINMGYDIYNPEEGLIYGLFLLKTEGIKHWSASAQCLGNYQGQGVG